MVAEKYKSIKEKGATPMVRYAGEDIKGYLNDKAKKSENTARSYKNDIEYFLDDVFNTDIDHVTIDQLERLDYDLLKMYQDNLYKEKLEKGKGKNTTINRKIASVRSLYKHLSGRGKIKINKDMLDSVENLSDDSEQTEYISVQDSLRIAEWFKKYEKHDAIQKSNIIYMAIETGKRISEILNLKWSDIKDIEGKIYITGKGKGKKKYSEVIPDELYELLLKGKISEEYVFTVKYPTLYASLKRVIKKLDINENVSLHSFRRTSLTYVYHTTGDLKAVQAKGNHATTQMASYYAAESDKYANGVFAGVYGLDKDLYKKVETSLLLEALGNIKEETRMMINLEIKKLMENKN